MDSIDVEMSIVKDDYMSQLFQEVIEASSMAPFQKREANERYGPIDTSSVCVDSLFYQLTCFGHTFSKMLNEDLSMKPTAYSHLNFSMRKSKFLKYNPF